MFSLILLLFLREFVNQIILNSSFNIGHGSTSLDMMNQRLIRGYPVAVTVVTSTDLRYKKGHGKLHDVAKRLQCYYSVGFYPNC